MHLERVLRVGLHGESRMRCLLEIEHGSIQYDGRMRYKIVSCGGVYMIR